MSDWKEIKLGDYITTNDSAINKDYPYDNIQYLDTGSITSNKIIDLKEFKLLEAPSRARRLVIEDDIIYSTVRPDQQHFGFIRNPLNNLVVSTGFVVIRCKKEKLFPKFLYYYLTEINQTEYLHSIAEASTSTYPSLKPSDIEALEMQFPPLNEQQSIASVLSSLDDKIDLLHRQNATLEKMAETLFRQWFIIEANEAWMETKLENHTDVLRGLSYKGSGLTTKGLGLPMHNLNSVYEGGGYKYEGIKYYSGEYRDRHLINSGDIIVTNTEQGHEFKLIGCPAIVPNSFGEKGLFSQHIYKFKNLKSSYLSNEFLYYLLLTPIVREQIIAATNGSTVNMLAIDGLQRPEFKLPPQEKVEEFTSIVSNYWKKKNINQSQIQTLKSLRDTLLPKLMSGTVSLSNCGAVRVKDD